MAARATTPRPAAASPVEVDFDLDLETFEAKPPLRFKFGGKRLEMIDPGTLSYLETSEQNHPTEIFRSVMSEEDFDHLMAQDPSGAQMLAILERFRDHFDQGKKPRR